MKGKELFRTLAEWELNGNTSHSTSHEEATAMEELQRQGLIAIKNETVAMDGVMYIYAVTERGWKVYEELKQTREA